MALLDRLKPNQEQNQEIFTSQEIEFLLRKLRLATYTGEEFEQFYTVYVKLTKQLETLK